MLVDDYGINMQAIATAITRSKAITITRNAHDHCNMKSSDYLLVSCTMLIGRRHVTASMMIPSVKTWPSRQQQVYAASPRLKLLQSLRLVTLAAMDDQFESRTSCNSESNNNDMIIGDNGD